LHLINKFTIMKNIYKFLILTFVASSTMFYSCETIELEKLENPTALTSADPDLLLNTVQIQFRSAMSELNYEGSTTGRILVMGTRNYFQRYGSGTVSSTWNNLYTGIMPDISAIEAVHSADNDLSFHLGVGKTLQATLMLNLVDWLGDIVYSEANNPGEFPSPALDDDAAVYASALALLDEARAYLAGASAGTATDLYYAGDTAKWIKFANTITMRANLAQGNYTAVINATNVISTTADDMQWQYGGQDLAPDTRHPDYATDYRSDGAGIYQSNWLMDLMVGQYGDFTPVIGGPEPDPRRRFYFYRQNWRTPGNYTLYEDVNGLFGPAGSVYLSTGAGNGETLQCSLQTVPFHLEFTPDETRWCSVQMGYWGRAHGNDEGTPPDGFIKTASGVYPSAGSFDGREDAFPYVGASPTATWGQQVGVNKGGGGTGIEPIMLASFVDFYRAEAYLASGDAGMAATYIESGMRKSIAKVQSFGSKDGEANSVALASAMDSDRIDDFVNTTIDAFNDAPSTSALDGFGYPVEKDKMDILGEQMLVAQFGAGNDAFNFIRRTGHPRTLARSLEEVPGTFPRTVLYPGSEVSANPSINQKTDLSTKVFWDAGVTNPAN
jgi:hypothetical protein